MLDTIEHLRKKRFRNKWSAFVSWLWIQRDVDRSFHFSVLEEGNGKWDDSLPSPALTKTDSINLFFLMEKKGLAFATDPEFCYILNKVEEEKWDEFVHELERPQWTRHWAIRYAFSSISFLIAALIGGFMGGFAKPIGVFIVRFFMH